jgi:hypothetical protein
MCLLVISLNDSSLNLLDWQVGIKKTCLVVPYKKFTSLGKDKHRLKGKKFKKKFLSKGSLNISSCNHIHI